MSSLELTAVSLGPDDERNCPPTSVRQHFFIFFLDFISWRVLTFGTCSRENGTSRSLQSGDGISGVGMSQLSYKERLVLLALQAHASGLTKTQLAAITGLPSDTLRQPLSRLENLGRATIELTGHQERCYATVFPSNQPLVPRWQEWLAVFSEDQPQFEPCDAFATTYASCGVVVLTAIVGGTKDADRITLATTLPVAFVAQVLDMADRQDIWGLDSIFSLHQQLSHEVIDSAVIESTLHWVKENLWGLCWTPAVHVILNEHRAGRQFGGKTDDWTEAEDVSYYG